MSNITNYCAEFLGDKKSVLKDKADAKFIKNAIKFRLPEGGKIIQVGTDDGHGRMDNDEFNYYIDILKLPYNEIVLEYLDYADMSDAQTEQSCKTMVLARNAGDGKIVFEVLFKPTVLKPHQLPCKGWGKIPMRGHIGSKHDKFHFSVSSIAHWISIKDVSEDEVELMSFYAYRLLCFVAALQCSNVIEVNTLPQPIAAPSVGTKSKKKLPIFSYKELVIDTKSKVVQQVEAGEISTQNTKRIHLRRGHIRRLTNKTIWVNPCVVGDKSKGVIEKDYKVV